MAKESEEKNPVVGTTTFHFNLLPKEIFKVLVEYLDFRDALR